MITQLYRFFGLILSLFIFVGCSKKEESVPQRIDMLSQVRDVGKLQLSEMTLTKVGRISDPSFRDARTLREKAEAAIDKMKIGTRIGVYSYQTYVTAYIDLTEISPSDIVVDTVASTVSVTLPPVRVEWAGRDMELTEEHYRVSGLRSNIDASERAELKSRMAARLKKEVAADKSIETSLKESAQVKATAYFTELFHNWGFEPRISFRR